MTNEMKSEMLKRLYDAYNAGYITAQENLKRAEAVHRAWFDAKYGKCDLSDIPA